jgi:hypothetical protein
MVTPDKEDQWGHGAAALRTAAALVRQELKPGDFEEVKCATPSACILFTERGRNTCSE